LRGAGASSDRQLRGLEATPTGSSACCAVAIRRSAREGKRIELAKVAALDAFRGPVPA